MDEILNGMKVLKLYAWEESFEKTITAIRDDMLLLRFLFSIWHNQTSQMVENMNPRLRELAPVARGSAAKTQDDPA